MFFLLPIMTKKEIKTVLNPPFKFDSTWEELIENKDFTTIFLSDVLEKYVIQQRWYGGKSSKLKYIELQQYFKIQEKGDVYYGLLLEVNFDEAFYQHYFLPIAFVSDENFAEKDRILSLSIQNQEGFIIDALNLEAFRKLVFERIINAVPNDKTKVRYHKSDTFKATEYTSSRFMGLEQSNTSIIFNDNYVMKFFRRIYSDTNPDYEMSRFLSEKKGFSNTPSYQGSINVLDSEEVELSITIALMQELVPNQGDAWDYMLKELKTVFNNLKNKQIDIDSLPKLKIFSKIDVKEIPHQIKDWVGLDIFLKLQTLANRTAEMHIALGSEFSDTAFTPAHFNGDYEVWLKNRLLYQFQNRLNIVENNMYKLEGLVLNLAEEFLNRKNEIRQRFVNFNWTKLKGERIRIHGDYHLGQVLVSNEDFYLLDFEGEPESTIRDRKVKQPPLKDVAGMFRSLHYAIYSTIFNQKEDIVYPQEKLFKAGEILYRYFIGVFLDSYVKLMQKNNLNIGYLNERIFILKYCMLEKAVYELGYEMNSRPNWAVIPLEGIIGIINKTD